MLPRDARNGVLDASLIVIVHQQRGGAFAIVQTQFGLPGARVGTMTLEASIGQDGADIAREIDLVRIRLVSDREGK